MPTQSFADVVRWLQTPAGLGAAVVGLTAVARKIAKGRQESSALARWVASHLYIVSVAIAIVLAAGAFLVQTYALDRYVEEWWPVVILILSVVTWGASQGIYTTVGAIGRVVEGGNSKPK